MSSVSRIQLTKCIWVLDRASQKHRHCAGYARALAALGVRTEQYEHARDAESVARVSQVLRSTDEHVVFFFVGPATFRAFYPVLKERRNYTVITDDWWNTPHWFVRNADYVLFRTFSFLAVRLGLGRFAPFGETPVLTMPQPLTRFGLIMTAARLTSLALTPVLQMMKAWQRTLETTPIERMIYFPYALRGEDVTFDANPTYRYDFSNVSNIYAPFISQDPFVPCWFTGANFYADRNRLVKSMLAWEGQPFRLLNWQGRNRVGGSLYDELCDVVRSSRFTVATGGIHQNPVSKFIENVCLGTPMIGRRLPYEHAWLDQCLFPIDTFTVNAGNIKPKLEEALALQPKMRESCLGLRDELLERYSFENVLRMAQDQIDGKPIPPGYLKVDFRSAPAGSRVGLAGN